MAPANDISNFSRDLEDQIGSVVRSESDGYHLYLVKNGTVTADYKLYFRDTGIYLQSSADGILNIVSDGSIRIPLAIPLEFNDAAVSVKSGTDGHLDLTADVGVNVNSPLLFVSGSNKIQLRDTGIYLSSKADTYMDLDADGAVRVNSDLLVQGNFNYALATNSGNNYSLPVNIGNLENGQTVTFKASANSTGSATLNVNTKGAKKLYLADQTTQITTELVQNLQYHCIYNTSLDTGNGGWWITNL